MFFDRKCVLMYRSVIGNLNYHVGGGGRAINNLRYGIEKDVFGEEN